MTIRKNLISTDNSSVICLSSLSDDYSNGFHLLLATKLYKND